MNAQYPFGLARESVAGIPVFFNCQVNTLSTMPCQVIYMKLGPGFQDQLDRCSFKYSRENWLQDSFKRVDNTWLFLRLIFLLPFFAALLSIPVHEVEFHPYH